MRRIFSTAVTLVSAIVLGTFTLAGCGDDPASGNDTGKGTMSAKVNGTAWNPSSITQASYQNNVLAIGGAQIDGGNNKQIIITGLVSGPGEYQLGGFTGLQGNYSDGSAASIRTFVAQSGTLKVDELSASGAKGTFSFEAKEQMLGGGAGTETRSITEGKFDVKF